MSKYNILGIAGIVGLIFVSVIVPSSMSQFTGSSSDTSNKIVAKDYFYPLSYTSSGTWSGLPSKTAPGTSVGNVNGVNGKAPYTYAISSDKVGILKFPATVSTVTFNGKSYSQAAVAGQIVLMDVSTGEVFLYVEQGVLLGATSHDVTFQVSDSAGNIITLPLRNIGSLAVTL